ncbi:MAG: hypothetical protein K2I74_09110, partial [Treponemataceae bacterium]|nr:hypothetical protein [Treponemataceae bacterium]
AAKEANWGLAVGEPSEDEFVPTKLKNNRLVSVIYPLTDFLDVTPGYREFDISGWFLLFFCIFFAMIFGDACYGTLITIAGLVALAKSKKGGRSLGVLMTCSGCVRWVGAWLPAHGSVSSRKNCLGSWWTFRSRHSLRQRAGVMWRTRIRKSSASRSRSSS